MTIKRVYIAGPYTRGDVAQNVRRAIAAADRIADHGFVPFLPHLNHFWHLVFPRHYEEWLVIDMEWLSFCDAVLRLSGESAGADKEVTLARKLNIPVFTSVESLLEAA